MILSDLTKQTEEEPIVALQNIVEQLIERINILEDKVSELEQEHGFEDLYYPEGALITELARGRTSNLAPTTIQQNAVTKG